MQPIEIVLIVASVLVVGAVMVSAIVKKAKGKSGCGCGCSGCPHASACQSKKTKKA